MLAIAANAGISGSLAMAAVPSLTLNDRIDPDAVGAGFVSVCRA
jgi:hypothetical protein